MEDHHSSTTETGNLISTSEVLQIELSECKIIYIIGRTAKSVTELLSFLGTIYGGGFLRIPTDSYSDVTFFLREERRGYQVSYFALDVKLTKWQKVIVT